MQLLMAKRAGVPFVLMVQILKYHLEIEYNGLQNCIAKGEKKEVDILLHTMCIFVDTHTHISGQEWLV